MSRSRRSSRRARVRCVRLCSRRSWKAWNRVRNRRPSPAPDPEPGRRPVGGLPGQELLRRRSQRRQRREERPEACNLISLDHVPLLRSRPAFPGASAIFSWEICERSQARRQTMVIHLSDDSHSCENPALHPQARRGASRTIPAAAASSDAPGLGSRRLPFGQQTAGPAAPRGRPRGLRRRAVRVGQVDRSGLTVLPSDKLTAAGRAR